MPHAVLCAAAEEAAMVCELYLPVNADIPELKREYRRLSRILHPDKNTSPTAADEFACLAAEYTRRVEMIKQQKLREEASLVVFFALTVAAFASIQGQSPLFAAVLATIGGAIAVIVVEQDSPSSEPKAPGGLGGTVDTVDEGMVSAVMKEMPMDWSEGLEARRARAVEKVKAMERLRKEEAYEGGGGI